MDPGHQEAFDTILNAGIQAELFLGTIGSRANESNCNSTGDYLEDRVSFSEDKLLDSSSKGVMMACEKPLMEAHPKAVCPGGGDILKGLRISTRLLRTPLSMHIQRFMTGWWLHRKGECEDRVWLLARCSFPNLEVMMVFSFDA